MRHGLIFIRANAWLVLAICLLIAIAISTLVRETSIAQEPLAEPPEGQTYVGTKECAACHFEQFMAWRGTPHAKAFETMPAKYHNDGTCLKCHTTGYGQPTGFKSIKESPNLAGNSCEGCHGAGSKHTEVAKSFGQKKLSEQEEAYVKSTIHLMLPKNVCVECHLATKHQAHPKYDK
jgi:hypothetical protein